MAGRWRFQVAYDGSAFAGWQVQPGLRTVQGEVERMLRRLGEAGRPHGAGRTDAGVHALANTGHVDLERDWDADDLENALTSLAPPDLTVSRVLRVGGSFHARYRALSRTYQYALGLDHNAFFQSRRWSPRALPDPRWVEQELASFRGERECASLAKTGTETRTTVCRILDSQWRVFPGGAVFSITADRFLYGMVRALTGLLVRGFEDGRPRGYLEQVLERRDRGEAGEAAPACGLYLVSVAYPGDGEAPDRTGEVARLAGLEKGGGAA
jgi:tRNA pseudouridine38-40 synthase